MLYRKNVFAWEQVVRLLAGAAMSALYHIHTHLRIGRVDLVIGDAFVVEQRLGGVAIGAPIGGVDLNLAH